MELYALPDGEDIDPCSGIRLCPSFHGQNCLGNGNHPELECCCDECDYFLVCFPEWSMEEWDDGNKNSFF